MKSNLARDYIKQNEQKLVRQFADPDKYHSNDDPFSIFMAGSPGAGKTETSRGLISEGLIQEICSFNCVGDIVRIDDDEVRKFFKDIGYDGTNTDLFKSGSIWGVDKLFQATLKNKQNFILDSTFSNYKKARENINICLKKKRRVAIFYIYLDPIIAWNFTIKRSRLEGRRVPKYFFIKSLFDSKENVNKIKEEFKNKIELTLIKRTYEKRRDIFFFRNRFEINIHNVDSYIKMDYTVNSLNKLLC